MRKNDEDRIAKLFTQHLLLEVIFGVLGFSVIMIGSSMFANMLGGQDTKLPLIVTSFALLITALIWRYIEGISKVWGYGFPTGLSQMIEQFIRVFFMSAIAFLFVSWNKGSDVATGGAMIGSCLGVITSLIYLRLSM